MMIFFFPTPPAEKLQEALATISAAIPALASSSALMEPVVSAPKVIDLPIPTPVSIPIPVPVSSECIMVDSGSDSEKDATKQQKQGEGNPLDYTSLQAKAWIQALAIFLSFLCTNWTILDSFRPTHVFLLSTQLITPVF